MKRIILLLTFCILISGCGGATKITKGYNDILAQLPTNEFKKFEYHRSGMYSSAHIIAKDAAKDGDLLMIDSFYMQLNYGPENLTVSVEGYIREVE